MILRLARTEKGPQGEISESIREFRENKKSPPFSPGENPKRIRIGFVALASLPFGGRYRGGLSHFKNRSTCSTLNPA